MSSGGNIDNANSASTDTFVTALVFNGIVFVAELAAFTILRPRFPAIYQPRTNSLSVRYHIKPLTNHILAWPYAIFRSDYETIKAANGLDAYFFVRFLRMFARILLPIWIISWAVLMPLTSVKTSTPGNTGLDKFTFGNVGTGQQARYAAHVVLAWAFTFWILWNLRHEYQHFVVTRQRWLIEPENANAPQASTVLITGIPQKYLTEAALMDLFSTLPGGVRKVWLNRDMKDMPDLYKRQVKACNKLEAAETKLLKTALKLRNKQIKADEKTAKKAGGAEHVSPITDNRPLTAASTIDTERNEIDNYVPREKRPSHRLPPFGFLPFSLPLIGKKVDSIEWARSEIAETTTELEARRTQLRSDIAHTSNLAPAETNKPDALKPGSGAQANPPLNAAFVLFNQQIAAHLAKQSLTHHAPYRMAQRYMNVAPEDVVWGNLGMNPYEARVRTAVSWAATFGLIIFWAVPVAFVGAVSNVHALCNQWSWLAWICNLPGVVVGIIAGILPPVLLAVLMLLLPIVLRLLSRLEGTPTKTAIELSLMTRFFMFQILHSFLIVTIASGIVSALHGLLNNPSSVPTLLAQQLPKASNFFLTYIVLQGLSGTASGFLQVVPLVLYYVKLFITGSTPRSVYNIKYGLRNVSFGTLFPSTTLLAVITITYSIISPIINGLAFVTFVLFYYLWKYLFLWQLNQPRSGDSGGLFYPKAIQHVFVGLYLQQICLAALFFLARNANNKASAIPEGAVMVVLIVVTAFCHLILNNSYKPLISAVPLSLADKTAQATPVSGAANTNNVDKKPGAAAVSVAPVGPSTGGAVATGKAANGRHAAAGEDAMSGTTANSSSQPEEVEDFAHPAGVEPQQIVWIPRDPLGLGETEAEANAAYGIKVDMAGAKMDEKGRVDVDRTPPGLDVSGH